MVVDRQHLDGVARGVQRASPRQQPRQRLTHLGVILILVAQPDTSSGIGQMVDADTRQLLLLQQVENGGQLSLVGPRQRKAQPHLETGGATVADALQRPVVGVVAAPESVVGLATAIETDAHVPQSCPGQMRRDGRCDQHAVGRKHGTQAHRGSMVDQVEDARVHQRFAAGEQHHLDATGREVVEQGAPLVEGEFVANAAIAGGIAMTTAQVAALRDIPDDDATEPGELPAAIPDPIARFGAITRQT